MGETRVPFKIYGADGVTLEIEAVVDTGATFSKIPGSIASQLRLEAKYESQVELGDGRVITRRLAWAEVAIQDVRRPVLIALGEEGERTLIGYTTLELLGFKVNPVTGKLERTVAIEYFGGDKKHLPLERPEGYPRVCVLICTLNEADNLRHVLPKIPGWVDEVLLVDGHSTDGTVELAQQLRPDIRILYQPGKGKGDALRCGIQQASGDIIVTLDADGTTDPEEMPRFVDHLLTGYDFVKGSRFALSRPVGKPRHRIFGNWLIVTTFNILFWKRYTDLCSGYNAFWKKSLERVNLSSADGREDEPLINARVRKAGLKVKEVGHHDKGRFVGESKAPSWQQGFKAIKTILRERLTQ